ncbi:MAG: thioredoxin domain-containing protein [Nitrososphaerota archaeon]|nr:thioredoxin family protein [Candidatus Bathyarchaeota archaeon]MDW8049399.1 thioredoxin domain-containing protein [Nitrososphaerota archaeon]
MSNVLDVNAEDWEMEVLASSILTVVDFWHERCPWCIRLNPIFEEVAEKYGDRVKFVRFNVLKNPNNREVAIRNGVLGTPTIAFYCDGKYLGSVVGFLSKTDLEHAVEDFMRRYRECVKQSTGLK